MFDRNFIRRQLIMGCECPDFTDIHTNFIYAIDIVNSIKKADDSNYYGAYIEYCGTHGIDTDYMREFMEYKKVDVLRQR